MDIYPVFMLHHWLHSSIR